MNIRQRCYERFKLVRLRYALAFTLILLFLLDLLVLRFEAKPDLILRNEGQTHIAIPYMFHQMKLTQDKPVVVFFGASVIQGLGNSTPDTTLPMQVQRNLHERGIETRCFNTAAIGNNLGDNLALATEAIRNGADLLVFNLHFKLFSGKGSLNLMTCHRHTVYFMRESPDFDYFRTRLALVPGREYYDIRLDETVKSFWAFYRERELIAYRLTGSIEPLPAQLRRWLIRAGLEKVPEQLLVVGTPLQRNRDDIWKEAPPSYHKEDQNAYSQIELDLENHHFQTLKMINDLAVTNQVKILFFVTPHNRVMNDQYKIFKWEELAKFVQMTREMAEASGNLYYDMTDAIDARHYTDMDHINIDGYKQLGEALTEPIAKALEGVTP